MALRSSRRKEFGPPLQSGKMTGNSPNGNPVPRLTQADQDDADDEKQRESMHALVQTWLDSLQLISVIATFFVATEVSWLVLTIPDPGDGLSTIGQVANIGIMSALIVHGYTAIISFLAAFYLIRHKLAVTQKEEEKVEENLVDSPKSIPLNEVEKARGSRTSSSSYADDLLRPVRRLVSSSLSGDQIIWSTDPHLVHVGPFQGQPPTELLARCHSLCVFLASLGFLLALVGVMCFTWDRLPRSIGISISISTTFCMVAAILILIIPSTKTSHILYDSH